MKRLIAALAFACLAAAGAFAQQQNSGPAVDNSGASRVSPYPIVFAFPGGCTYGDVVTYALGTPGSNTYICGATRNWVAMGASGGSSSVNVNGSPVSNPNFNGTTPAAGAGNTNVIFQVSGSSVSGYLSNFVPGAGALTGPGTAQTLPASLTSGGVVCNTSTSQMASSVLIAANALMIGGGAGACPTGTTAIPNGTTATTQSPGDNSTKVATTAYVGIYGVHAIPFSFGTPGGAALATGVLGYLTVPFACTITGWSIQADAGTDTVTWLKVAAGTAIPTLGGNSISTSGVALSSGTVIQSTTVTDFTTTAVAANDIIAADLITTSGTGYINTQLVCQQ